MFREKEWNPDKFWTQYHKRYLAVNWMGILEEAENSWINSEVTQGHTR